MGQLSLFDTDISTAGTPRALAEGALFLGNFAAAQAPALLAAVRAISTAAPFARMQTPGGRTISVAITSCGSVGWFSDRNGYRYTPKNPRSNTAWPPMPGNLLRLAQRAAEQAGYPHFTPDSCLINRYEPGNRLSLHQDKNERDYTQPIVSVSLGVAATFLFGGSQRSDRTEKVLLQHGDVVVWGGASRLVFHGIAPLPEVSHPLTGRLRINLTFRKAL